MARVVQSTTWNYICGESAIVDSGAVSKWKEELSERLQLFKPHDVFNLDETALFYRCLPDKTLAIKGETCCGGKLSKDRLTVLVGANMVGSEKFPLLVIGKYQNPRCFKNIRSLPVCYTSNKRAWMTSDIFEEYMRNLDKKFANEDRKVLMFIDNCPAHPQSLPSSLKNIRLLFFPPNCTCVLQPCDQGIIRCLKQYYRRYLLERQLTYMDNGSVPQTVSVLDSLFLLRRAWNNISAITIANCFAHAGFIHQPA